jgi:hypothetical protein
MKNPYFFAALIIVVSACDEAELQAEGQSINLVDEADFPGPADEFTNREAESYEWAPGEREEAIAEAAEYNAMFGQDLISSDEELPMRAAEADPSEATCALELVEPCIAPVAICAVRCCDDALFKSAQVCGNCGTWASGACANHGTRKRIRWE